jgi:hypothetical protein
MDVFVNSLAKRNVFPCDAPSVRDDEGNCINFVTAKWNLQGPKLLLLIGFIASILGGCATIVFIGTGFRARKKHSSEGGLNWIKDHTMRGAMLLALW